MIKQLFFAKNAVDAAVATGLELLYCQEGNIGGGGLMVVYMKDSNKTIAIDYREKPSAEQETF